MTYDDKRVRCPLCGVIHFDGTFGQWFDTWQIYLCGRCVRTGATEGFNHDLTRKIEAHLRRLDLGPPEYNQHGFAMLPVETVRITPLSEAMR